MVGVELAGVCGVCFLYGRVCSRLVRDLGTGHPFFVVGGRGEMCLGAQKKRPGINRASVMLKTKYEFASRRVIIYIQ